MGKRRCGGGCSSANGSVALKGPFSVTTLQRYARSGPKKWALHGCRGSLRPSPWLRCDVSVLQRGAVVSRQTQAAIRAGKLPRHTHRHRRVTSAYHRRPTTPHMPQTVHYAYTSPSGLGPICISTPVSENNHEPWDVRSAVLFLHLSVTSCTFLGFLPLRA